MEYEGLIEGLVWATRLNRKSLIICGDSRLIINQVTGKYLVKNPRLKCLLSQVKGLLQEKSGLSCTFKCIPLVKNGDSKCLAIHAKNFRENYTGCYWPKINKLMQEEVEERPKKKARRDSSRC